MLCEHYRCQVSQSPTLCSLRAHAPERLGNKLAHDMFHCHDFSEKQLDSVGKKRNMSLLVLAKS